MNSNILLIGIGIVLIVVILAICYVKAPPKDAYVISGLSRKPRILIGKGGLRIPGLERVDKVFLGQTSVDIKTSTPVPTNDFISVWSMRWLKSASSTRTRVSVWLPRTSLI